MRAGRATTGRDRRTGRALLIAVSLVVSGAAVFWIGVALGRALEEAPDPGRTRTLVRTLEPGTLPPVTRTITVTTASR